MVDALSVATMAARRMLPPLQNLGMNDLPGDVLQEIAEKMIDLENPADVCAKWAEWCRVMKNGPAMCTNPDDGAWKRGCALLGLDEKSSHIDLRDKTWRDVFNILCDNLHRLAQTGGEAYHWYIRFLEEKKTGARGNAWLRRCAASIKTTSAPYLYVEAEGTYERLLGIEAIVDSLFSAAELVNAFFDIPRVDRAIYHAGTVAEARAAFEAGADVDYSPDGLVTPLLVRVGRGPRDLVEFLIRSGADVNARAVIMGVRDYTALISASRYGRTRIVRVLIAAGADVNARDARGRTALMWASYMGYRDVVDVLLAAGADVRIEDDRHWRASDHAARANRIVLAMMLGEREGAE